MGYTGTYNLQTKTADWIRETFGDESLFNPVTRLAVLVREVEELKQAMDHDYPLEDVYGELADVQISLYALAEAFKAQLAVLTEAKLIELSKRVYTLGEDGQWTKSQR